MYEHVIHYFILHNLQFQNIIVSVTYAFKNNKVVDYIVVFISIFKNNQLFYFFSIVTMIGHLQRLLNKFVIPIAFINGDR